jgi:putative membrane protein
MATASAITDKTKFHTSEFQAYFTNPYNASRTMLLFLWDVILEWRQFRAARKNNVQPILDKSHRGGLYPFIRAAMTILMRELNIYTLIGDVFAGRKSAYATFVGYDEIAHHSGCLIQARSAVRPFGNCYTRCTAALSSRDPLRSRSDWWGNI